MRIKKIDHIGIAVSEDSSLEKFFGLSDISDFNEEIIESENLKVRFIEVGDVNIELLYPLNEKSPVHKFIAKKGPGIHHIAYEVDNIEEAAKEYISNGFKLINEEPKKGAHNSKIIFIHPRSVDGVLTELVEKNKKI